MPQGLQQAGSTPNQLKADSDNPKGTGADDRPKHDDQWLLIARDAYNEAESYYDANIRADHERNMSHFHSKHAPGSKYYSEAYNYRHKGFRPKTRSFVRRQEATLLKSMFSTADFVTVKAARSNHPSHQVSAEMNQHLLQYRLENTIPWFQTVLAAYQETLNLGICISYQYWDYEEEGDTTSFEFEAKEGLVSDDEPYTSPKDEQEQIIPGDEFDADSPGIGSTEESMSEQDNILDGYFGGGDPQTREAPIPTIVKDTPATALRPAENVFFSVAADFRDPAGTSPFIIDKIPMFIDDVKAMASGKTGSGNIPWFELTESQLLIGKTADYDPVRRQREGNREDSKDQTHLHRGFDTVWVHRNIIKKDGVDWLYYTLGVHYRLSDPIPLRQEFPWLKPGERPYVIGFSNIEAHRNYPESLVGLGARTQQDANQLNNSRFDNVELSLNRRYIVKRSAMIDYRGLQRNVPGGVTETDDPVNDIKIESPPDVTSGSYNEQDRINADYDELVGMFSGSSVSTNSGMNETVGGMKLLAGDADSLTEYPMMVFMITWVIPTLKQIVRLEQTHESDGALLNLLGEKAQLWQRYRVERVTDKWIQGSMNLQVSASFGSANPEQRLQRLAAGFGLIFQLAPGLAQKLEGKEVGKEILAIMGYQGTDRFFPEGGPEVPGVNPDKNKGDVTENDQAKLDQDFAMHQEKMQAAERKLQWDIERFFKEEERHLRKELQTQEIGAQEFQAKMERIASDRQTAVDEMRVKLQVGSGI